MADILYYYRYLCIFIRGFLILKIVADFLPVRKHWFWKLVLYIGCFLLGGMVIYIGDRVNLSATMLLFLFAVFFSCEGNRLRKLTVALMLESVLFSFHALIDNFYFSNFNRRMIFYGDFDLIFYKYLWNGINEYYFRVVTSNWIKLGFTFALFAGIRHFASNKEYDLTPSMWKLLLLLTSVPTAIVLSLVLLSNWSGNYLLMNDSVYLVLLIVSLISFVGLLWTVMVLSRQKKLEQQSMLAELNSNYYEMMAQQHFEIRRFKHDMANHLQILSALEEEKRTTYIEELLHHITRMETLSYCADTTVNAVLTVKAHRMQQNQIRFSKYVDITEGLSFEKVDLCAVFANALDNAIESCMDFPEKEREIVLETKAKKGLFVLEVKNPCRIALKKGELPKTSKTDAKNHGLGLCSIREIVERYGGDMEMKAEDGVFELFLYLPLEQK